MASHEGEKQKFIVKWVGSRKRDDDARGRSAADILFNRVSRRSDVKSLLKKLSKR